MSREIHPQAPVNLRCDYVQDALGIDNPRPKLSWVLQHPLANQVQGGYQIIVSDNLDTVKAEQGNIWDTGQVESSQSIGIPYEGSALQSCRRYYWRVRWWDKKGRVSPYSRTAFFETAFLAQEEWTAEWIGNGADRDPDAVVRSSSGYELRPGSLLRKEFTAAHEVTSARAYISGLGYYELRINGQKVGDRVLEPGQTDYAKTVLYSVYDVTADVRQGANAVGVMLGNGRYVRFDWNNGARGYDGFPRVRAELHLEYADGSQDIIATDETWQVARGPVEINGIYEGESYDARKEIPGWDQPGLAASAGWDAAICVEGPTGLMRSQLMPPIKVTRRFQPVTINCPAPGVYVYDFGQNFTGWVQLRVQGPRGAQVQMRYAEVVDENGRLDPRINRSAAATDTYTLKGEGQEVYEPRFTYHGFRYVEVTGYPGTPSLHALEGCFLHTAVEETGRFACSNSLLNNVHRNVIYGQLSNLMSVPTDCPQRDERMGWLGDAQLVAEEAIYNFDMAAFYVKYLQDIMDSQRDDGSVSDVVPPYWPLYPADPAWGTAYVVLAWEMYRYYGDLDVLKHHYSSLKKYVDHLIAKEGEDGLVNFNKYGDWCPPGSVPPKKTPREITSAFCYYHDILILSRIAELLGKTDDHSAYAKKAGAVRDAFNKRYFNQDRNYYGNNDQTANVLGLQLGLVPPESEQAVLDNLVREICEQHDYHFDTGIVGTKFILDTLSEHGHKEIAYKMMTQDSYPSFGYMIKEGATTIWERWEKLTGTGMNSHNHIMFGTVDVWLYRALAGIRLGQAGWSSLVVKPIIPRDLNHASATINTIRGMVSSRWAKTDDHFRLEVTVPVNSNATIYVPGGKKVVLEMDVDGQPLDTTDVALLEENGERYFVVEVGSGTYTFAVRQNCC